MIINEDIFQSHIFKISCDHNSTTIVTSPKICNFTSKEFSELYTKLFQAQIATNMLNCQKYHRITHTPLT